MVSGIGKLIRLNRIFKEKSKRTFIVAMDHGSFDGPILGIENPLETLKKVLCEGVNALIITPGICKIAYEQIMGKASIILRISGAVTKSGMKKDYTQITRHISTALKIGADAVAVTAFVGGEDESKMLKRLSFIAEKCDDYGMPLLAEMIPAFSDKYSSDKVSLASRVGAELGADIIKTYYTGSIESFKKVVNSCPVPIVIAGGPKIDNPKRVIEVVKESIEAGGKGVAFGRNVWQHHNPKAIAKAIASIIHEDFSVEEAFKILEANL
ncbi:MAG: 2-amino-3,7-dideoxy-D-threo-hept-6-ulosonate synthase [Candidatus Bathyarchaeia archaeon]